MDAKPDPKGVFYRRFYRDHPKNYTYWEALEKLMEYPRFEAEVWLPLVNSKPLESEACPYWAACEVIHAACIPIESFIDKTPVAPLEVDTTKACRAFDRAMEELESLPVEYLQKKADEYTDYSSTGHILYVEKLIQQTRESLNKLTFLGRLPKPEKSELQPTKIYAKRAHSTAHAKLLKKKVLMLYGQPLHAVIAAIVSAIQGSDFNEGDVSRA